MAMQGGKEDLNTPVETSDSDVLPGGLGERQARSYRRARQYHRGTAVAVVGSDGETLGSDQEDLLAAILYELRALRLGLTASGISADIGDDVEAFA